MARDADDRPRSTHVAVSTDSDSSPTATRDTSAVIGCVDGLGYVMDESGTAPGSSYLVCGRSATLEVCFPKTWKLNYIDTAFKLMEEKDLPEIVAVDTIFDEEYLRRQAFCERRVMPKTEMVSATTFAPLDDPLEKGQMVVTELEGYATDLMQASEAAGGEPFVPKGHTVYATKLALPKRETKLMTPVKGRKPFDAVRFHIGRVAFGMATVCLSPANAVEDAGTENRLVFLRLPLIRFHYPMETTNLQMERRAAILVTPLPQLPESCNNTAAATAPTVLSAPSASVGGNDAVGSPAMDESSDSPRARRPPKWRAEYLAFDASSAGACPPSGTSVPPGSAKKSRLEFPEIQRRPAGNRARVSVKSGKLISWKRGAVARVRRIGNDIVCPYQSCPQVILTSFADIEEHLRAHVFEGDMLLRTCLHLRDDCASTSQPAAVGCKRARSWAETLPEAKRKQGVEEVPAVELEVLNSSEAWHNNLLWYTMTREEVEAHVAEMDVDRNGMMVCDYRNCREQLPLGNHQFASHYRSHFMVTRFPRTTKWMPVGGVPSPVPEPTVTTEGSMAPASEDGVAVDVKVRALSPEPVATAIKTEALKTTAEAVRVPKQQAAVAARSTASGPSLGPVTGRRVDKGRRKKLERRQVWLTQPPKMQLAAVNPELIDYANVGRDELHPKMFDRDASRQKFRCPFVGCDRWVGGGFGNMRSHVLRHQNRGDDFLVEHRVREETESEEETYAVAEEAADSPPLSSEEEEEVEQLPLPDDYLVIDGFSFGAMSE